MIHIINDLPSRYTKVSSVWELIHISPYVNDYHELISIDSFAIKNKKGQYEIYDMHMWLKEDSIVKYIKSGQLYVKKNA